MSVDCSATILYGWDITDIYNEHSDFFEQFEDNICCQSAYSGDSAIFLGVVCEGTGYYDQLTPNLFDALSQDDIEEINKIADAYYKEIDCCIIPKFYLISRWW